jgi:hypothetical protein
MNTHDPLHLTELTEQRTRLGRRPFLGRSAAVAGGLTLAAALPLTVAADALHQKTPPPQAKIPPTTLPPQAKVPHADVAGEGPSELSHNLHKFLGDYPKDRETGWSDDIQGVTHDADNWFIAQTKLLWKFPVGHDLNRRVTAADPARGILRVGVPKEMASLGYNHFGDIDWYRNYVFVPVTGNVVAQFPGDNRKLPAAIAVFRGSNLSFVGYQTTDTTDLGWCAFNPADSLLYTSGWIDPTDPNKHIRKYAVDWVNLAYNGKFTMSKVGTFPLHRDGKLATLKVAQGGVFPNNGRLYMVNGYYNEDAVTRHEGGIHVFDVSDGQKGVWIGKSTNGSGDFNYQYKPYDPYYEEPEGITYWDLNDGRAPGIRGVLHVLLLDNDVTNEDDLYFKHYQ